MAGKLDGQTVIVTGASSGIGRGVALGMARAGANVVVNYRSDEDGAREVESLIEDEGSECLSVQADVSKEDEVKSLFSKAVEKFGSVQILVANAGIQDDSTFIEMSYEQWKRVISVNLDGQFLCCREAARQFIKQGVQPELSPAAGKIICMSSVHEVIPWAGHVNYAASKGGVNLMMRSIAQELAPAKIRINSIAPGAIKTPINQDAWSTPEALTDLRKLIPYGRIGEVEDIAHAAVWLASDESDYVQGTTLFVDGGMSLYPEFADGG